MVVTMTAWIPRTHGCLTAFPLFALMKRVIATPYIVQRCRSTDDPPLVTSTRPRQSMDRSVEGPQELHWLRCGGDVLPVHNSYTTRIIVLRTFIIISCYNSYIIAIPVIVIVYTLYTHFVCYCCSSLRFINNGL